MAIKAIVIRLFTGTLSLPEGFDLDYDRDPIAEPVGGGFVAVVEGLAGYGVALVKTSQAKIDILAADPETVAILSLSEPADGDKWPELDDIITPDTLTTLNGILALAGAGQLPSGISVRNGLGAVAPVLDWGGFDVG